MNWKLWGFALFAAAFPPAVWSAGGASPGLPKLSTTLTEGAAAWTGTIKTGDRTVNVEVSVEIRQSAEGWIVRHVVSSPIGDAIDIAILDKQTLESIGRESKQGPMSMKLETRSGKVAGSLQMGAQSRPIEADAGGPLFADGIAGRMALACLPLAEGYTTTYRTFDPQQMRSRIMELKVAGSETITVAAGKFDTYRIEVRALEGTPDPMTLWFAKDSRKMVKVAAMIGPAAIAAELK